MDPLDWSPDGRFVGGAGRIDPKTGWDLMLLPVHGERKPVVLLQTPDSDSDARFSPDGKWLAYHSLMNGRSVEVSVQAFRGDGYNRAHRQAAAGLRRRRWSTLAPRRPRVVLPEGRCRIASVGHYGDGDHVISRAHRRPAPRVVRRRNRRRSSHQGREPRRQQVPDRPQVPRQTAGGSPDRCDRLGRPGRKVRDRRSACRGSLFLVAAAKACSKRSVESSATETSVRRCWRVNAAIPHGREKAGCSGPSARCL